MHNLSFKQLINLALIAMTVVIIAMAVTGQRRPARPADAKVTRLVAGLTDHLNDLTAVSIKGAGEKPLVTLKKSDKGWTVDEKSGYPADLGKLREWLLKVADADLLEKKTAVEARHAELGVEDIKAPEAKGVQVKLEGGLAKPAEFIIGNINSKGGGTFVRAVGDKQSWLAKGTLSVDKDAANWLNKPLADVASDRIKDVQLSPAGGKTLRVYKDQALDLHFKVADVPKGRELSSDAAADPLGSTLTGLTLDDVLPAAQAEPPTDGKTGKAHYATFDGIHVEVITWKADGKNRVRLSVRLDEAAADAYIGADQAKQKAEYEAKQKPAEASKAGETDKPAEAKSTEPAPLAVTDPAKDKQQRLEALNAEVSAMDQRFNGWTFVLADAKFDNLDKSIDSLLKPLENKPADVKGKLPAPAKPKN